MTNPIRPTVRPPRPWSFPAAEEHHLANGLRVLVHRLPGQYVVSAALMLDTPLTTEPPDAEGVALITATTLSEGTAGHPGTAFLEAVEACGAVLDASVGQSHAHVIVDVPASHLATALGLLAEAVREPQLAEADVDRHRQVLRAQWHQQLATGSGRAGHALRRAVIDPSARASRSTFGSPGSLDGLTAADVRAHHAATYGPRGSVLVISGDVGDDVIGQVEAALGNWRNPGQLAGVHESPAGRPRAAWLIDRPGSVQADLRWGWFTIDRADERWPALQIATHALGGAYLSRLNRVLREEKGFSYGVGLSSVPLRRGGYTHAHGSFRTEVLGEALALMPGLLDVAASPVTREEVDRARDYLTGTAPLRYATASGVTLGVVGLLASGLEADVVEQQLAAYRAVTPEEATVVAGDLLSPTAGSLVVVGDADALAGPLREAGWEPTVVSDDGGL